MLGLSVPGIVGRRSTQVMLAPDPVNLVGKYAIRSGVTWSSTMLASPGAPGITLSGATVPEQTFGLEVQITDISAGTARGQAKFRISADGGRTWLEDQTTSVSYSYTNPNGTVTVLAFGSGTYNTSMRWNTIVQRLASVIGNETADSPGAGLAPVLNAQSFNGFQRFVTNGVSTRLRVSTGTVASLISGTNKPFTLVVVGHQFLISNSAAGGQSVLSWARSAVSASPFFSYGVKGAAGTPANAFTATRSGDDGVQHALNDATTPPDLLPHVWVLRSDGTSLTVTQDNVTVLSGAQVAGAMTIDRFTIGGIERFGVAFAGTSIGVVEMNFYSIDVGATDASRLANMFLNRYAIQANEQVHVIKCIINGGASNSNGVSAAGAGTPSSCWAPPPGNGWTQIPYLRRCLAPNGDAISDSVLQSLQYTNIGSNNYHSQGLQAAIDVWYSGRDTFLLQVSADGSSNRDWFGAGTYAAGLTTAIADSITLLTARYPNAVLEWYFVWEGYIEVRDASPGPNANAWASTYGSIVTAIEGATGQSLNGRVVIVLCPTILTVAPSSAPQFAVVRSQQAIAAAAHGGLLTDPDTYSNRTGYVMTDNTHYLGRCANGVGLLNGQNLISLF